MADAGNANGRLMETTIEPVATRLLPQRMPLGLNATFSSLQPWFWTPRVSRALKRLDWYYDKSYGV